MNLYHSDLSVYLHQMCCVEGYGAASGVSNGQGPQPHGESVIFLTLMHFLSQK